MKNKVYPRPHDKQIVYLKDVITKSATIQSTTTSSTIPAILRRTMCCITTPSTGTN